MRTFCIQTLGCKVNQYESEQIATLLRHRGMVPASAAEADLRIVNTCSVTAESASKSRQTIRRAVRLNVLSSSSNPSSASSQCTENFTRGFGGSRVIAMGCWATSNRTEAEKMAGVDAVITHHDDVAAELGRLLDQWHSPSKPAAPPQGPHPRGLPLLNSRHTGHQRAFLKIQDGCDAHCTYCIIPQLRPRLWSKPIEDCLEEARTLVAAGHRELVLTGIFLSAYGHTTALRRRQTKNISPLAELLERLCTEVPGLMQVRLSSLEPGDLTPELLKLMRSLPQVAPHFHLPLQSGSSKILRRMNRQYNRDDFLQMIDAVHEAYDRIALTTDVIAGFPGETDEDFQQTLEVAERARFIHVHAFPYSARPGTAAARWDTDFVPANIASQRVRILQEHAAEHSRGFRCQFLDETLTAQVEESCEGEIQHGRTAFYFPVYFSHPRRLAGKVANLRVLQVKKDRTWGELVDSAQ